MQGGLCNFMTKDSIVMLHLVVFGCCQTWGNEKRLRSHLGEALLGNYAMNKCPLMTFGQQFVCVTDWYPLIFILWYDQRNPTILRLQIRFMC
jgi:hypothetical protein